MRYLLALSLVLLLNLGIYPQAEIVLIAHNNYLVGGTLNGNWVTDLDVVAKFMKPTKFFGFDSFGDVKISEIYGVADEIGCGATYFFFSKTAKMPENRSYDDSLKPTLAIGANANWDPLPRKPKEIGLTNKTYQKIAVGFSQNKEDKCEKRKAGTSVFN